jgi:hypothetical protein
MSDKTFDPRCVELAAIFLDDGRQIAHEIGADLERCDLSDVDDLAITIQLAIEEWLAAHPVAK